MGEQLLTQLVWPIVYILCIAVPVIIAVAMFVYWERKVIGWMHVRLGPNKVGPFGLLQAFADVVKLLIKEVILPSSANRFLYYLAPLLALIPAMAAWAVIPFSEGLVLADVNAGVLYLLAMSSLGVYGIILAGWASNSRYALLGAMRSAAQVISYELAMGLCLVCVLVLAGSLNLTAIVHAQAGGKGLFDWFWLPLLPVFLVYFISGVAETNRAPVRRGRGRIGNRRRLPRGVFRLGLRDLLPGRIRQHDPDQLPGRDPVPGRLAQPAAGLDPRRCAVVDQLDLDRRLHLAVHQGLRDVVPVPVVPRQLPALPL